jgi:secondary thiamine-phosphate synthase enzyme
MTVINRTIQIKSSRENDIIDITEQTSKAVKESKIDNGIVTVFVTGSTTAITTIEYEPGLQEDFPKMLSRVAPKDIKYAHDNTWHDGNGHSHVRASLIGPSLTIPFIRGHLMLGTWQQIVLLEMDTRPRERKVILQIVGE